MLPILQAININNNKNVLRKLNSTYDAVVNNVLLRVRQKLKWHNKSKHYLKNFQSILYVEKKFLSAQYRKEFINDIHYELLNCSNSWSLSLRWIIKKERSFRELKSQRAHYVIVLTSINYRFSTSSSICVSDPIPSNFYWWIAAGS